MKYYEIIDTEGFVHPVIYQDEPGAIYAARRLANVRDNSEGEDVKVHVVEFDNEAMTAKVTVTL